MRIGFTGNDSLPRRRFSAVEACAAKIKTAPEKMYRAALADETRAKFLKDPFGRKQYSPQAVRVFRIVRCVGFILIEWNRVGNFLRLRIYLRRNSKVPQRRKQFAIKSSNGFSHQRQRAFVARRRPYLKSVIQEIELNFEGRIPIRNRRGGQAASVDV